MQGHCKSIHEIHHMTRFRDRDHLIILLHAEKVFDKIQNEFILKILMNLGIEETNFKIIKAVYNKPTANIVLNRKNLKAVPSKSGISKDVHSLHYCSIL